MSISSVIFGLLGPKLTASEKAFFRDVNPWGFILFARNIETPAQVQQLTQSLRDTVGRNCLIFIDQEGGRVQRLRPPHWYDYPSLAYVSEGFSKNPKLRRRAVFLHHRLIAADLRKVGVNANCAPVLDIPVEGADPIISDRALGGNVKQVCTLGHAAMAGMLTGGVAPVIKHIPGHGRATVDSHLALPRIETSLLDLLQFDFVPFKALSEAPMAMTAHLVVEEIDRHTPVTISRRSIEYIRSTIGFGGLLMSDDLDMKALKGSLKQLTEKSLRAGCDIALQCSGDMTRMVQVAKGSKSLSGTALSRAIIAENCTEDPRDFDYQAGLAEYEQLVFQERLAT